MELTTKQEGKHEIKLVRLFIDNKRNAVTINIFGMAFLSTVELTTKQEGKNE